MHKEKQPSVQEYKLWYDRPAQVWTEALPLGNGRLGAMVWNRITRSFGQKGAGDSFAFILLYFTFASKKKSWQIII